MRRLIIMLMICAACKARVERVEMKSLVGLESAQYLEQQAAAAPSFLAISRWFLRFKLTGQKDNSAEHVAMTDLKKRLSPQLTQSLLSYYEREEARVKDFMVALAARNVPLLTELLDRETWEMHDIIMVALNQNYELQHGDLLAAFMKVAVKDDSLDMFARDALHEILQGKYIGHVISGLEKERDAYASALKDYYLMNSEEGFSLLQERLEKTLQGITSAEDMLRGGAAQGAMFELTGPSVAALSLLQYAAAEDERDPPEQEPELEDGSDGLGETPSLSVFQGVAQGKGGTPGGGGTQDNPPSGPLSDPRPNPPSNVKPSQPARPVKPLPPKNQPLPQPGGMNQQIAPGPQGPGMPPPPVRPPVNPTAGASQRLAAQNFLLVLQQILARPRVAPPVAPPTRKFSLSAEVSSLPPEPAFSCDSIETDWESLDYLTCKRFGETMSMPVERVSAASSSGETFRLTTGEPRSSTGIIEKYYTAVKDQGKEGACTAFGMAATVEQNIQAQSRGARFDAVPFWNSYKKPKMAEADKAAKKYSWTSQDGKVNARVTAIRPLKNIADVMDVLDSERAVWCSSGVNDSWFDTRKRGNGYLECGSTRNVGHAYSIQGYRQDENGCVLIIKNSWGPKRFGEQGYGYIRCDCYGNSKAELGCYDVEVSL